MKKLILIATLFCSIIAQAQTFREERNRIIDAQTFQCSPENNWSEIELKGFWMDMAPRFLGGARRDAQSPLACAAVIQDLYNEGSPRLFTLLAQFKSIKYPQAFAGLFGEHTKFSDDDIKKIGAIFQGFGLNMNQPLNGLAKTLNKAENATIYGGDTDELALEISGFMNKEKFPEDAFRAHYEYLINKNIGGAIISLEQTTRRRSSLARLHIQIKALANLLFRGGTARDWSYLSQVSGRQDKNRNTLFNPYAYLLYTGRSEVLGDYANPGEYGNPPLNFAVAILNKDAALLLRTGRMENRFFQNTFDADLCQTILGEIVRSETGTWRDALMKIYKSNDCRTLNYAADHLDFDGVSLKVSFTNSHYDLLDAYPRKHVELTRELVKYLKERTYFQSQNGGANQVSADDLRMKASGLVSACAAPADVEVFANYSSYYLELALEAKCEGLIQHFSEEIAEKEPVQNLYNFLLRLKPDQRKSLRQTRLTQMLSRLEKRGFDFTPAHVQQLQKEFGAQVTKAIRIARRVHGEAARELLLTASQEDTEDKVILKWRDLKIELIPAKLSEAQLKLVDRLRQAQTEEEVQFALRDSLLAKQLKVRGLRTAAKTDFEALLAKENTGVVALAQKLEDAKTLLDKTLNAGGRTGAYNESATSVFDIVQTGRMQCYSGTEFLLLNLSMSGGLVNSRQAAVTVFRPQHVLAGVYDFTSRKLGLVESTVEGAGRSEITGTQLPKDTQVILADDYLLIQSLDTALFSSEQVRTLLLARASKVLGMKQGEITRNESGSTAQTGDTLNKTIFGFGRADIPRGDVPRGKMDVLPQGLSPEQMITYSQPRPDGGSRLSRFQPVNPPKNPDGAVFMQREERPGTPEIAQSNYQPLLHLITTAQTELIWKQSRGFSQEKEGAAQKFNQIMNRIFETLPEDVREEILEQVAKTPRALVDLFALENSEGIVAPHLDSPMQQGSEAISMREVYLRAQNSLGLFSRNRFEKSSNCGKFENDLQICRPPKFVYGNSQPVRYQVMRISGRVFETNNVLVWVLNGGQNILSLSLPRDARNEDFILEFGAMEISRKVLRNGYFEKSGPRPEQPAPISAGKDEDPT